MEGEGLSARLDSHEARRLPESPDDLGHEDRQSHRQALETLPDAVGARSVLHASAKLCNQKHPSEALWTHGANSSHESV